MSCIPKPNPDQSVSDYKPNFLKCSHVCISSIILSFSELKWFPCTMLRLCCNSSRVMGRNTTILTRGQKPNTSLRYSSSGGNVVPKVSRLLMCKELSELTLTSFRYSAQAWSFLLPPWVGSLVIQPWTRISGRWWRKVFPGPTS